MNRQKISSNISNSKHHLSQLPGILKKPSRRTNSEKFLSPIYLKSQKPLKSKLKLSVNIKTTREKLRNLLQNTCTRNELHPVTSKSLFPKLSPIISCQSLKATVLNDSRISQNTTIEKICTSLIFK
jgi:hypothetical protein